MEEIKRYYFIGIGGIGMSALARYVKAMGADVAGYDRSPSELTAQLESEGIPITFEDDRSTIESALKVISEDLLVVRTPAVPIENDILTYFQEASAKVKKRSELLARIAASKTCIAVAGTHGKTTTTSILAHLLASSEIGCTAFVGGIMPAYNGNVIIDTDSPYVVLEADEFDRSFHHLDPYMAIITSTDADHLDIYETKDSFGKAFEEFAKRVGPKGLLLHHVEVSSFDTPVRQCAYDIDGGTLRATNVHVSSGQFHFDLEFGAHFIENLSIPLPGRHNVLNALAACGIALEIGISELIIRKALASYVGVKRRFELVYRTQSHVFIDDYAHHPTEIEACISSVRELYPDSKLTVVFQPHLYSRTRDFMTGFAESLSQADEVILLPIYPARELPIQGVDSEALLDLISVTNRLVCEKGQLPSLIATRELEVLLTLGAGDIDRLIPAIKKQLSDLADA
jgi:UDP-N-acetylmuramate--alanine ligase